MWNWVCPILHYVALLWTKVSIYLFIGKCGLFCTIMQKIPFRFFQMSLQKHYPWSSHKFKKDCFTPLCIHISPHSHTFHPPHTHRHTIADLFTQPSFTQQNISTKQYTYIPQTLAHIFHHPLLHQENVISLTALIRSYCYLVP